MVIVCSHGSNLLLVVSLLCWVFSKPKLFNLKNESGEIVLFSQGLKSSLSIIDLSRYNVMIKEKRLEIFLG